MTWQSARIAKDFKIEMLFQLYDKDNEMYLDWCHGEVKGIVNRKNIIMLRLNGTRNLCRKENHRAPNRNYL